VEFGVITTMTGGDVENPTTPYAAYGAEAAAKALNKTCALHHPIKVVVCDSMNNANSATACGQEMVSDKVVAFMGYDEYGAQWFPVTSAAGIPEIGGNGLSSQESSSPLWYPFAGDIHDTLAFNTILSSAVAPAKLKEAIIELDSPSVTIFNGLFTAQAEASGGSVVATIPVPPTASDMSTYVAEAIAAGANAIVPIIGGDQFDGMLEQMVQQGSPPTKIKVVNLAAAFTCQGLSDLGTSDVGMYLVDDSWPVGWNTNSAGAKTYIANLKAAKLPYSSCDVGEFGIQAWEAVQLMEKELAGSHALTAAALVAKLNTMSAFNSTALAGTINFVTNPFASAGPPLSVLRISTNEFLASQIQANGKPELVTPTPATIGQIFTPHPVKP
jgi:ABC-type branched-subunit amino acid transport system substrate-binding protein